MVDVEFEIDRDKQTLIARCPEKLVSPIHVKKSAGGFCFFEVHLENGKVPAVLSGKYSSLSKAQEAVHKYLNTIKPSRTVRRDENTRVREERKKQNATEPNSKSS